MIDKTKARDFLSTRRDAHEMGAAPTLAALLEAMADIVRVGGDQGVHDLHAECAYVATVLDGPRPGQLPRGGEDA